VTNLLRTLPISNSVYASLCFPPPASVPFSTLTGKLENASRFLPVKALTTAIQKPIPTRRWTPGDGKLNHLLIAGKLVAKALFIGASYIPGVSSLFKHFYKSAIAGALALGQRGLATHCIYQLGTLDWHSGLWGRAEETWLVGARLYTGNTFAGSLSDDPNQGEVISTLIQSGLLEPYTVEDPRRLENTLYNGKHWLISGPEHIAHGCEGLIFKIFGEKMVFKRLSRSYSQDIPAGTAGVTTVGVPYEDEEVDGHVVSEARALMQILDSGIEAMRVYGMYREGFVREFVPGPITVSTLMRSRYGLSTAQASEARRKYHDFKRLIEEGDLLREPGLLKNAVYDLERGENGAWVLFDS